MKLPRLVLAASLLSLSGTPTALAETKGHIRRIAMLVSSNNGGAGRVPLRYANRDARRLGDVLQEIGGVARADGFRVENATPHALNATLESVKRTATEARHRGERPEILFYFSGHSDEQGVLLEGERLSWEALRTAISSVDADMRLVVLDSCSSGALTRVKGGVMRPAFTVDQSSQTKGMAVLTSSSATEASQESDAVGGAFFTHYLVAGLRGAADSSHEGRVTLNEAYQYAFHETLNRTQKTHAGPQHPSYDFRLVGSGDVVLTDLRMADASLELSTGLEGTYYVFDSDERIVAEVVKREGSPLALGLPEGAYRVFLVRGSKTLESSVNLRKGEQVATSALHWATSRRELTQRRGPSENAELPRTHRRFAFEFLDLGFNEPFEVREVNNWTVNVLAGRHYDLKGWAFSLGGEFRMGYVHGGQVSGVFNWVGEELRGLQTATFANHVRGTAKGVQLTSGYNGIEGDLAGAQFGGLNMVKGHVTGAQIGSANVAESTHGAQVGFVNVAGKAKGFQLGIVNVARELEGESLGVVNVVGSGFAQAEAWTDTLRHAHLSVMTGSRHLYSFLDFALDTRKEELMAGFGFGGRAFLTDDFMLMADFGLAPFALGHEELALDLPRLRTLAAADLFGGWNLFAGTAWHPRTKIAIPLGPDDGRRLRQSELDYGGRRARLSFLGGVAYKFHGK